MPEPNSTIVVGALAGAGASTVTLLLGAQVDALAAGLAAAVFVTIWLPNIDTRRKAAAAVLFAAMLAGYGSPVAAGWIADKIPSLAANIDALRMLMAVIIGGGAPTGVPIALRYIGRKGASL